MPAASGAGTGGGTGRTAAPADADSRDRTGSEDWLTGVPCEGPTYTHTHALRHEYERVCVYWATSTIVEHHVSLDLVELCDGWIVNTLTQSLSSA
jgi:hypothetical protein